MYTNSFFNKEIEKPRRYTYPPKKSSLGGLTWKERRKPRKEERIHRKNSPAALEYPTRITVKFGRKSEEASITRLSEKETSHKDRGIVEEGRWRRKTVTFSNCCLVSGGLGGLVVLSKGLIEL